jgi:hypothetical protein
LLAAPFSHAACSPGFVLFSGSVVDAAGVPIAGIPVGVAGLLENRTVGPALTLTDASGQYSILLRYNTYSGQSFLGADQCRATLRRATISAYGSTHRSEHVMLEIAGRPKVDVDPLRLAFPVDTQPVWPGEAGH